MAKNKSELLTERLLTEIAGGAFGGSGERFLSVRKLSETYGVSLVTAQRVIKQLNDAGVITLFGKAYFITTGKIAPTSSLQNRFDSNRRTEQLIGIHIPKINNPFFSALLNEVTKAVYKRGFTPVILCSDQDPQRERNVLETFIAMGVTGVISCPNNGELLLNRYKNYPLPLVYLANRFFGEGRDFAMVDDSASARHVAHHLIDMEYRHYMYIGLENARKTDIRCKAFTDTLKDEGETVPDENIIYIPDNEDFTIPYSVSHLIQSSPKPLGIFCFHDMIAVQVILLCEKLGLHIPQDIGVVGFDDLPIAKQCRPKLTSIAYRFDKMAEAAADLLMHKIDAKPGGKIRPLDYVNHSLKIRDSSRKKPL